MSIGCSAARLHVHVGLVPALHLEIILALPRKELELPFHDGELALCIGTEARRLARPKARQLYTGRAFSSVSCTLCSVGAFAALNMVCGSCST